MDVSPELVESIARDERECAGYHDEIVLMMTSELYRKKLSYIWWRLRNDGYEVVEKFDIDIDAEWQAAG